MEVEEPGNSAQIVKTKLTATEGWRWVSWEPGTAFLTTTAVPPATTVQSQEKFLVSTKQTKTLWKTTQRNEQEHHRFIVFTFISIIQYYSLLFRSQKYRTVSQAGGTLQKHTFLVKQRAVDVSCLRCSQLTWSTMRGPVHCTGSSPPQLTEIHWPSNHGWRQDQATPRLAENLLQHLLNVQHHVQSQSVPIGSNPMEFGWKKMTVRVLPKSMSRGTDHHGIAHLVQLPLTQLFSSGAGCDTKATLDINEEWFGLTAAVVTDHWNSTTWWFTNVHNSNCRQDAKGSLLCSWDSMISIAELVQIGMVRAANNTPVQQHGMDEVLLSCHALGRMKIIRAFQRQMISVASAFPWS